MKFPYNSAHSAVAENASTGGVCEGRRPGAKPPLGSTAKSVDQLSHRKRDRAAKAASKIRRKQAYQLQRTAARLLPDERVGLCRWAVQSKDAGVNLMLTEYEAGPSANFSGLQTCGSVWMCPCCGRRISETRRAEINDLLAWARVEGLRPVMITLTARHGIRDNLAAQVEAMKKGKQRLRQRREWRAIKDRIAGSVTATEVTYGDAGWHTHFHEILLIRPTAAEVLVERGQIVRLAKLPQGEAKTEAYKVEADRVEVEALAVLDGLSRVWRRCLTGVGLSGGRAAWHAQGATAAGQYAAKWGAGEELTLTGSKAAKGKGRTPLQLLAGADEGDDEAGRLWVTFARAFKSRRQLVWSPGLKERAGIGEVSDEEAATDQAQDAEPELILTISHGDWAGMAGWLGARHRRSRVLDAAETGGADAALRVVMDGGADQLDRMAVEAVEDHMTLDQLLDVLDYEPFSGGMGAIYGDNPRVLIDIPPNSCNML